MSDADDQMGGTGGETGLEPSEVVPGKDNAAPVPPPTEDKPESPDPDEESKESFPASDPPGNY